MTFSSTMCWLHVSSSLHIGAGQGTGFIDLPIMREKTTNWPLVPGSALKGVLRDHFASREGSENALFNTAFGATSDAESQAGALVFGDLNLVALPVRSLFGTFAYATSALTLQRLKRTLTIMDPRLERLPDVLELDDKQEIFCSTQSVLISKDTIYLEEFDYRFRESAESQAWAEYMAEAVFPTDKAWQQIFKERFAIIPDESFNFFAEHGTEVVARIRIKAETKIVESGALWYEESLPAESILAGVVWCDRVPGKGIDGVQLLDRFCTDPLALQLGGKASVGKGRVEAVFSSREGR